MTLNYNNMKYEVLNMVRNSNVFTISERGMTTAIDTFTAAGGAEEFALTNNVVHNVRYVNVNDIALTFGSDYVLVYSYNSEGFRSAITGVSITKVLDINDVVTVQYDYSSSADKIYPDWPQGSLTINSFPRLGFSFLTGKPSVVAVDGVEQTDFRISFTIKGFSIEKVNDNLATLRQLIKTNQQGLYYSNILRVVNIRAADDAGEVGKHKIFQAILDVKDEINIERS
jgi:hypothetical protein